MSVHTPGPWARDVNRETRGDTIRGSNGAPIAEMWQHGEPDTALDAALIAAAPDLLEAAELALAATGPLGTLRECKDAHAALLGALAKARGES